MDFNITSETLERLSNLDLQQYAGNLEALRETDRLIYERLMHSPVEVKVTAQREGVDRGLYEACLELQGSCVKFEELRRKAMMMLSRRSHSPVGWNLLSVLFNGIYIGDPEDLLNYRTGRQEGILYPVEGLGKKVAEVRFVRSDAE